MNVSRFFGSTNREALRQVRLALGPDALIISSKRVNGGVEILATDQTSAAGRPQVPDHPPAAARATTSPSSGADLLHAIDDLKGSLESRMDDLLWGSRMRQSSHAASLFQSLLRAGFSTALLRAMLQRMPGQPSPRAASQWARSELIRHLPVLASEENFWRPGLVLALVGPTGVGKTTTIAKLAARCIRQLGNRNLVLLTTDTYRIGAHEQMRIYGEMLRVPVYVVQDAHELRQVMQTMDAEQVVMIDNVGISQRDRYIAAQAAMLASAGAHVQRLLVLNAASDGDTLDEVARNYRNDDGRPLIGCIITKIDEAQRLGAVLDTAIRHRLPIHFVSNGQKVPDHLQHPSATMLVDQALTQPAVHRTLYTPSEADLAVLMSMAGSANKHELAGQEDHSALLPQLLSRPGTAKQLDHQQLEDAMALLDNDPLMFEAWRMWQEYSTGNWPDPALELSYLRQSAQSAQPADKLPLVAHASLMVDCRGQRGRWLGSAWFDVDGMPLTAGDQRLVLAGGSFAPDGASLHRPDLRELLRAQMQAESPDGGPASLHAFKGVSARLLHELEHDGRMWLAQCPASTTVLGPDNEAIVLSALCRQLDYQPLPAVGLRYLSAAAGLGSSRVTWWLAVGQARWHSRGRADLLLHVLCLQAIDKTSGETLAQRYGLASLEAVRQADPLRLAQAMLALPSLVSAWRPQGLLLAEVPSDNALPGAALLAAQQGLAALRLCLLPDLQPAASVAAHLLGSETIDRRCAHDGLNKLFTLKQMLQAGG